MGIYSKRNDRSIGCDMTWSPSGMSSPASEALIRARRQEEAGWIRSSEAEEIQVSHHHPVRSTAKKDLYVQIWLPFKLS